MARRALSYLRSNHLAVLALVFAMAGTSVAASHLGRNSVGARQIKTGAVTSAEVKNHSLKRPDFVEGVQSYLAKRPPNFGPVLRDA